MPYTVSIADTRKETQDVIEKIANANTGKVINTMENVNANTAKSLQKLFTMTN